MIYEYAGVHLLDTPFFLDNNYDYYIPSELRGSVCRGSFVSVPFGTSNRKSLAVVTELRESPLTEGVLCKPVFSVCNEKLTLSDELLSLAFFVKEQTLCTLGEAVRAIVPAAVLSHMEEVFYVSPDFDDNFKGLDAPTLLICDYIRKKGSVRFDLLKNKFGPQAALSLKKLREVGAVLRDFEVKDTEGKSENFYSLNITPYDASAILSGTDKKYRLRSPMHVEIIRALSEPDTELSEGELISATDASKAQIRAVESKGLIKKTLRPIDRIGLAG